MELLLATMGGILAGTITGLIPGVHVNLVAVVLVSITPTLDFLTPTGVAVMITATAVTHTFLDVLPSVFLGVPSEDMILSILPGHKLVLEGKGYEAVRLTTVGSLGSLLLALLLLPLLIWIVPVVYDSLQGFIGWILMVVICYLFWREEHWMLALVLFAVSGLLGLIVLELPLSQPLLPLLSGLYGVSGLVLSLQDVTLPPLQQITHSLQVNRQELSACLSAATLSGWITSLFPGLGSAQAAILSTLLFRDLSSHLYLVVIGGINTVNFTLSLVTFYTIEKARNGAIVAIQQLLTDVSLIHIALFSVVALVAGGIGTWMVLGLGRVTAERIDEVPYAWLSSSVIGFVCCLVYTFTGWLGIVVLITSSALGMLAPLWGVGRIHLMGCLLIPVLGYFF